MISYTLLPEFVFRNAKVQNWDPTNLCSANFSIGTGGPLLITSPLPVLLLGLRTTRARFHVQLTVQDAKLGSPVEGLMGLCVVMAVGERSGLLRPSETSDPSPPNSDPRGRPEAAAAAAAE